MPHSRMLGRRYKRLLTYRIYTWSCLNCFEKFDTNYSPRPPPPPAPHPPNLTCYEREGTVRQFVIIQNKQNYTLSLISTPYTLLFFSRLG
jgi:hypothetical protein